MEFLFVQLRRMKTTVQDFVCFAFVYIIVPFHASFFFFLASFLKFHLMKMISKFYSYDLEERVYSNQLKFR